MSTWQLNKSYRLVDVSEFIHRNSINRGIFSRVGKNIFKVIGLSNDGCVTEIEHNGKNFSCRELNLRVIFSIRDYSNFEEVADITSDDVTVIAPVNDNPVANWFVKFNYVLQHDPFVHGIYRCLNKDAIYIATEFGDVYDFVPFIEYKYDELFIAKQVASKKELEQKRLQLLEDLSKLDQELNRYGE